MRISLTLIVLLLAGYVVFAWRFELAADFWHWRYGQSFIIRDYQVPVPDGWLVWTSDESHVSMRKPTGKGDMNVVTVGRTWRGSPNLDAWKDWQEQNVRGRLVITEKTLQSAGETVMCVASGLPSDDFLWVLCSSTGKLTATYFGRQAGLENFYGIVSQVRKFSTTTSDNHPPNA